MDCGSKIIIAENKKEYTVNYNRYTNDNYTYRKIDDARIREADVHESIRLKELEIELEKTKNELKKEKASGMSNVWAIVAFFGMFALIVWVALTFS